jgi:hypothetical protein
MLAEVLAIASALGGAPQGKAEFLADCPFSHRAATDPIVHRGHKRAGHLHDFFGARITNGTTTNAKLRASARTTCDPKSDRSAYWVPTLFDGKGRKLTAEQVTIYYTTEPELAPKLQPFPADLRIVAGNAKERGKRPGAPNTWGCLGEPVSGTDIVTCPAGSKLELLLNFPGCWDGRRSDSPNHHAHMAYAKANACPKSHPVPVPQIQFKIRWPTRGGPDVRLATGKGYTAHGDFMNGWEPNALQQRIDTCLKPVVKCGSSGRPLRSIGGPDDHRRHDPQTKAEVL